MQNKVERVTGEGSREEQVYLAGGHKRCRSGLGTCDPEYTGMDPRRDVMTWSDSLRGTWGRVCAGGGKQNSRKGWGEREINSRVPGGMFEGQQVGYQSRGQGVIKLACRLVLSHPVPSTSNPYLFVWSGHVVVLDLIPGSDRSPVYSISIYPFYRWC